MEGICNEDYNTRNKYQNKKEQDEVEESRAHNCGLKYECYKDV